MSKQTKEEKSTKMLYAIVVALTVASLAYRIIDSHQLEQTTLLFIGLPALLTVMVIRFVGTPKSSYGVVFKVITLFLLMSGILLGEGVVCIVFAAPLFYGVAAICIFINKQLEKRSNKLKAISIIPICFLGIQFVNIEAPNSTEQVTVVRTISPQTSFKDLNFSKETFQHLPAFLSIGFPKPISIQQTGTYVKDTVEIMFESTTKGMGTLSLQVVERTEKKLLLNVMSDSSHINHWLSWERVEINLESNIDGTITCVWTTDFKCGLGPSWYFVPLERYAVVKSTEYLIDMYFGSKFAPI